MHQNIIKVMNESINKETSKYYIQIQLQPHQTKRNTKLGIFGHNTRVFIILCTKSFSVFQMMVQQTFLSPNYHTPPNHCGPLIPLTMSSLHDAFLLSSHSVTANTPKCFQYTWCTPKKGPGIVSQSAWLNTYAVISLQ